MSTLFIHLVFLALLYGAPVKQGQEPPGRERCLQLIKETAHSADFWVQVHAIEYLVALGYRNDALLLTQSQLEKYKDTPEKRIGLWRVKSRIAPAAERRQCLNRIVAAYLDTAGADRIHAAETLSKLHYCFHRLNAALVEKDLAGSGMLRAFVNWGCAQACTPAERPAYGRLISALWANEQQRKIAAYALSFFPSLPVQQWDALVERALAEPRSSAAYACMLAAACQLYQPGNAFRQKQYLQAKARLLQLENSQSKDERVQLCTTLARHASPQDREVLNRLLQLQHPITALPAPAGGDARRHPWNQDVQAAAAFALLKQQD